MPSANAPARPAAPFQLVRLANGSWSVFSAEQREVFHPVIGPAQEAELLYVRQTRLAERVRDWGDSFVIWDVGLGSAANALAVLRALREIPGRVQMLSFDRTVEPLRFGFERRRALRYFDGFEAPVRELLECGRAQAQIGAAAVDWRLQLGDFPNWLAERKPGELPAPRLVMFDPYSPAKNPEMWMEPVFTRIFRLLPPRHSCVMPTYSRSTMLRVTWLLAGFYVGRGGATGEKEETTLASNRLELLESPLGLRWLERARRSRSAEPLREPKYRQAPLGPETWRRLRDHPQFQQFEI